MNGSSVVEWGETEEDVLFVAEAIETVVKAGERAHLATEHATARAAFEAELRGAATMLGLVAQRDDVAASLRAYLLASRDHEGETSEGIIRAAAGLDEEGRRAARVRAMCFSGRRGVLDSAVYWIDRGVAGLKAIGDWEASRAARV